MMKRLLFALGAASVLLSAAPAWAEDPQQAKAHFAIGTRAYDDKKFRVAVDAFEEAYRLAPRPAILFSIAQAYKRQFYIDRQVSDLAAAVKYYKRYIAEDPKGSRVGEAGAALADLEPMAEKMGATEAAVAPPPEAKPVSKIMIAPSVKGAKARVDGGPPLDVPASIEVTPGNHTVVVSADGYVDEQREIGLEAGGSFALDVKMVQKPALVSVDAGSGVRLYVDGLQSATTPLPQPLEIEAGRHVVSFTETGSVPVTMEFDLGPGEQKSVKPDFKPSGYRITSILMLSAGSVVAAGGAVLAGLAFVEQGKATDIDAAIEAGNVSADDPRLAEREDAIERRDNLRAGAIVGFGAGGALLLTGALLYVLDHPSPDPLLARPRGGPDKKTDEAPPSFEIDAQPSFGPDGASLTVRGRF